MKNTQKYMAILLGLLIGAAGTALADSIVAPIDQDATIFEPDVAQGTWTDQRVRWQSDDAWGRNHPVSQFDLSGIVLGAGESITVNYARFAFWAGTSDDSGPGWTADDDFPTLAMYYNTSAWSDAGGAAPTFDNSVSVTLDHFDDGTLFSSIPANHANWLFFDDGLAGTLVEYWVNGLIPNNGVQIQGTGAYTDTSRYLHFQSNEGGVQPYLYIDYNVIPEPATLSLFGVFGIAFWVLRKKFMI